MCKQKAFGWHNVSLKAGKRIAPGTDGLTCSASPGLRCRFKGARLLPSQLSFPPPNMFFAKASLVFVVVSFAAIFCAQSVEAARGPKITSKVYFDIKHGDEVLGRSTFTFFLTAFSS